MKYSENEFSFFQQAEMQFSALDIQESLSIADVNRTIAEAKRSMADCNISQIERFRAYTEVIEAVDRRSHALAKAAQIDSELAGMFGSNE